MAAPNAIGAVVGLALGIVVSVTTSVPLAPELGAVLAGCSAGCPGVSADEQRDVRRTRPRPTSATSGRSLRGYGSDVLDVDLAGDHLVPEVRDYRRDERQPILGCSVSR